MQTEMHTNAGIELEPKPTTKDREERRREKQRLESEPRKVQRQRLMTAIVDAVEDEPKTRRQQKKRRRKPRKRPQEARQLPLVVTDYMTTQEAAAYLKLSRQFLEAARYKGDGSGPPYIKLERAVRYRKSVLDAWMAKHDHAPDEPI
jgi:Helix-turn-helix domain